MAVSVLSVDIFSLIEKISAKYNIDYKIISAIIATESDYDIFAIRFEPNLHARLRYDRLEHFAKLNRVTESTEAILQCSSFGLAQVLGMTARNNGFHSPLPMLFLPDLNIDLACKIVSKLIDKYSKIGSVISAYNAGSLTYNMQGEFLNQAYVRKVLTKYASLESRV